MKPLLPVLIAVSSLFADTIREIRFEGNKRTKTETLQKMADLSVGDSISDSLMERASQRLLKSDLFTSAQVKPSDSGSVTITVEEKWSIIPFISFSGNGTALVVNTGLYDANFLGRAITIGADYTYLYGTHNGSVFAMKDNIGSHNIKLTGKVRSQKGINRWYDFDSSGSREAGFVVERSSVFASAELPVTEKLTAAFAVTVLHDTISESIGEFQFDSLNSAHGFHFSGSNRSAVPQLSLRYSSFKYRTFTYGGWGVKAGAGHGFDSDFGGYSSFFLAGQYYKELPLHSNFCVNGELYGADGDEQTNQFYTGGMTGIRGFPDGFFRGKALGKLNCEYRIPSLNTKWIVLQHVFFSDLVSAAPHLSQLDKAVTGAGGGVGIRILSPKIYSFMIRLDYGWGYKPFSSRGFSFGTTHYFRPF